MLRDRAVKLRLLEVVKIVSRRPFKSICKKFLPAENLQHFDRIKSFGYGLIPGIIAIRTLLGSLHEATPNQKINRRVTSGKKDARGQSDERIHEKQERSDSDNR